MQTLASAAVLLLIQVSSCDAFVVHSAKRGVSSLSPSASYLSGLSSNSYLANLASSSERVSEATTSVGSSDRNGVNGSSFPSFFSAGSAPMTSTSSYSAPAKSSGYDRRAQVDKKDEKVLPQNIWESASPITVQGSSLRTWSFTTNAIQRVGVFLKTEGRPLNTNIELWQGPDNTPQKMSVYIEDGCLRPFSGVIETPRGQNTIAIRNTGQMEFPLLACVEADIETPDGKSTAEFGVVSKDISNLGSPKTIQGGAVHTYPFSSSVASVQILLKTDGRPLNARIELLQGPNNNKQVIEVYTEDGRERPFFALIETPGSGNVVRIVNTATVEFPMTAIVAPYLTEETLKSAEGEIVGGGYFVLDKQL